jgi:hypothetical protein
VRPPRKPCRRRSARTDLGSRTRVTPPRAGRPASRRSGQSVGQGNAEGVRVGLEGAERLLPRDEVDATGCVALIGPLGDRGLVESRAEHPPAGWASCGCRVSGLLASRPPVDRQVPDLRLAVVRVEARELVEVPSSSVSACRHRIGSVSHAFGVSAVGSVGGTDSPPVCGGTVAAAVGSACPATSDGWRATGGSDAARR